MKFTRIGWWLGGLAAALVGCGSDDETGSTGSGQTTPARSVSILVDANRDGYINDLDEAVDNAVWDSKSGASFLANLDDDDANGARDADDEVVNGNETDAYDLARIFLRGFPDAPAGASGTLTIDAAAAPYVRLFRFDEKAATWTKALDATTTSLTLSEAEVKAGIQLGIEAKAFVGTPEGGDWTGFVQLDYTVSAGGKPVSTATSPDGRDTARLRVAPWMMFGNSTPHIDTVFAATTSKPFVDGLTVAIDDANAKKGPVSFWKISNWPGDQWVEDYFQTGTTSIPWAEGEVHGLRASMPRPWGRSNTEKSLPVNWLRKSHTTPDLGHFVVYKKAFTGSTFDSHGNHDLIPPYKNGANDFPYGRIIYGDGVLSETAAFYEKQEVQAPALVMDTNWLYVGHIDEVVSYVPAATPRGWKLLVASSNRAIALLKEWQSKGQGAQEMFVGKRWSDGKLATISIDEVLGDADLMAATQRAQSKIDPMVEKLKQEIGLTDDDVVELPVIFESIADGGVEYSVAYSPGVVNLRAFNGWTIVPDPFGPKIDGKDGFRVDIDARLGTDAFGLGADGKGLAVFYADDWDLYHRLDGEVHCGSNQEGRPPAEWKWWTRMQTTQGVTK